MDILFEQMNQSGCCTHLVASAKSGEAWLIDPVLDHVDNYLQYLQSKNLTLTHVIDTHTHADHISGGAKLMDLTNCAYLMHALASPKCVSERIQDKAELKLNGVRVEIRHTPGHTRDSMCLVFPDRILTGDTLFLDDGGAGRDDLPGGDPAEHWESLQLLKTLADDLIVYPGHEYRNRKPASLATQKERNPFFRPRSKQDYVAFLEALRLGPAEWMKEVLKANASCARDGHGVYIPQGVSACEVLGTACASGTQLGTQEIPFIDPPALKERIEKGDKCVLLDVRELHELTSDLGHLPGIRHIPVGSLGERVGELSDCKGTEIITICKMGGRAKTAAKILNSAGFDRVTILTGGMMQWNADGLPTERDLQPSH